MSDQPPDGLPDIRPRPAVRPPFWTMWGRETVKDLVLLLAAIPGLATLVYVPVLATSGGSWLRLLGLFVAFCTLWWFLRFVLRRWVAAGDRGGDPPSRG